MIHLYLITKLTWLGYLFTRLQLLLLPQEMASAMEGVASSSLVADLRDLASLYQDGLLTRTEYAAAKQQVLGPEPRARERETEPENDDEDGAQEINEDHFTKHAKCYHHGKHGRTWKGGIEGRNIVEQAMIEILKNDTYIGFSHNEKENSVYLLRREHWRGIDDGSIGCERRPVPQGLPQKKSDKWTWHSLYIKK